MIIPIIIHARPPYPAPRAFNEAFTHSLVMSPLTIAVATGEVLK